MRRLPTLIVLTALAAGSVVAEEATVPVVVAVDTSRSLSGVELGRVAGRAGEVLRALPAGTPAGLLAFDDEPRWIVEPGATPADVAGRLSQLAPSGSFTLLHDALFAAAKALPDGGVVLLFTDGRDENSATTVEDIARRSDEQGVRILPVGVGRAIEEKALRRLALLTGGSYLGPLAGVDAAAIDAAVGEARRGVEGDGEDREAAQRAAAPPPAVAAESTSPASPPPPAPPVVVERRDGIPQGWFLAAAVAAVVAAAAAVVLARRRPPPFASTASCPTCGAGLPLGSDECPACAERELHAQLAGRDAVPAAEAREVTGDTVVFERMDPEEALEKTRVLTELSVLLVRERGEEARAFLLAPGRAFAVGRTKQGNTLALPDPALSAHHFKVVPDGGRFYFVDLDTTNGSWVNGDRVRARELKSGDVIRAGQVEFELKVRTGPLL